MQYVLAALAAPTSRMPSAAIRLMSSPRSSARSLVRIPSRTGPGWCHRTTRRPLEPMRKLRPRGPWRPIRDGLPRRRLHPIPMVSRPRAAAWILRTRATGWCFVDSGRLRDHIARVPPERVSAHRDVDRREQGGGDAQGGRDRRDPGRDGDRRERGDHGRARGGEGHRPPAGKSPKTPPAAPRDPEGVAGGVSTPGVAVAQSVSQGLTRDRGQHTGVGKSQFMVEVHKLLSKNLPWPDEKPAVGRVVESLISRPRIPSRG